MMQDTRYRNCLFLGLILVVVSAFVALGCGRFAVSFSDIVRVLSSLVTGEEVPRNLYSVVVHVRLPRVATALLAGAGLAAAGAAFQSIFSNPLATPDTLGVTSGAAFGAVLAILLGANAFGIQCTSFAAGILAVVLVYSVSRTKGTSSVLMLILSGLVISAFFSALITLVKYVADPQDVLPAITFWMMGSITSANIDKLMLSAPAVLLGCAVLWLMRWKFNALSLSDQETRSLGINVFRLRVLGIGAATLISAGIVSMCGLIGWVGLLIPHFVRLMAGASNVRIIPLSFLYGSFFLLACDTAARSVGRMEIPVSILTAVLGAPVFLWLLRKSRASLGN